MILSICSFDNLYIHKLIEIFILLLLTLQVVAIEVINWSNNNSSSRTRICCSSSSISSSVDRMPFGQWIFPFKYFLRFNLIHKSILKTRYFDNLNAHSFFCYFESPINIPSNFTFIDFIVLRVLLSQQFRW